MKFCMSEPKQPITVRRLPTTYFNSSVLIRRQIQHTCQVNNKSSLYLFISLYIFYIYCYKMYFDQTWLGGPVSNVGGPVPPRPITGYAPAAH